MTPLWDFESVLFIQISSTQTFDTSNDHFVVNIESRYLQDINFTHSISCTYILLCYIFFAVCHRFKGNSPPPFFSVTMISAFKQVQKSARESGLTFKEYCKYPFCYFARLLVIYTFVLSILFPLGCFSFNYCHCPLLFSDAALMISLKIQSRIIKASTQKQTRQKQKTQQYPIAYNYTLLCSGSWSRPKCCCSFTRR